MNEIIQVGDKVKLIEFDQFEMTVIGVRGDGVDCVWLDAKSGYKRDAFDQSMLKKSVTPKSADDQEEKDIYGDDFAV